LKCLIKSSLSEVYWQEARSTPCYLHNRFPGAYQQISKISSYEQYYGVARHAILFEIFISQCYTTVLNKAKEDHGPKTGNDIFLVIKINKSEVTKYMYKMQLYIITSHVYFKNDDSDHVSMYKMILYIITSNVHFKNDDIDHVSDYPEGDSIQSRLTNVPSLYIPKELLLNSHQHKCLTLLRQISLLHLELLSFLPLAQISLFYAIMTHPETREYSTYINHLVF